MVIGKKRAQFDDEIVAIDNARGKELHNIKQQFEKHHLKGPIMLLAGHDAEIFTCKFHPSGTAIVSAGTDRSIYLWSTRGDCENYAILKAAHSNTIMDLAYSMGGANYFLARQIKLSSYGTGQQVVD